MKKLLFLVLGMLCLPGVVFASGEVVGHIYSTDIVAYIDDVPINSYNIGGKTAVIVEELIGYDKANYSFDGEYNDETRTLNFYTTGYGGMVNEEFVPAKNTPGKIVGDIYSTDIKVYLNSIEVKGYNIGGKTAVAIEDIATINPEHSNAGYGFSEYLCNFVWDGEKREIYLNTYIASHIALNESKVSKVQFMLYDNDLKYNFDQMNDYGNPLWFDFTEDFAKTPKNLIMPLYMDGELLGDMHIAYNDTPSTRYNSEKVKEAIEKTEVVLSFEEAKAYIEDNFEIVSTEEDENALIYIAKKDDVNYCLLAMKQGGFVRFYGGTYTVFELRPDEEYGRCLYCYPTAGTPGSGLVGMLIPVDTAYYLKK